MTLHQKAGNNRRYATENASRIRLKPSKIKAYKHLQTTL